jgi:hypothetical protein
MSTPSLDSVFRKPNQSPVMLCWKSYFGGGFSGSAGGASGTPVPGACGSLI